MFGLIVTVVVVLFLLGSLFTLRAHGLAEARKRRQLVETWQNIFHRRQAPYLVFRDDNAIIMWQPPGARGYVVAQYVCDYRGRSYELSSTSQLPYEEALALFNSWREELESGNRYRSGLLYPPYKER